MMLRLFRLYQRGEMGAGYLPDAGGLMDQAVVMLEAFDIMAACEAREKDKDATPLDAEGNPDTAWISERFLKGMGFS